MFLLKMGVCVCWTLLIKLLNFPFINLKLICLARTLLRNCNLQPTRERNGAKFWWKFDLNVFKSYEVGNTPWADRRFHNHEVLETEKSYRISAWWLHLQSNPSRKLHFQNDPKRLWQSRHDWVWRNCYKS